MDFVERRIWSEAGGLHRLDAVAPEAAGASLRCAFEFEPPGHVIRRPSGQDKDVATGALDAMFAPPLNFGLEGFPLTAPDEYDAELVTRDPLRVVVTKSFRG